MNNDFLLPDLGEGLTEAEVVSWLVQPGDIIVIDQPVVEVESSKSVVELPSPYAGIVTTLHAVAGQVVHAGEPLLTISSDLAAEVEAEVEAAVVPGTSVNTSGAVLVGYGTREWSPAASRSGGSRFGRVAADNGLRSPVVSPIVRKLARSHGFDASTLTGTGPDRLVRRSDVLDFAARLEPTPAADSRTKISGARKTAMERLSASRREIPEATIWMDVDATELFAAKQQLERGAAERFSITALIARFVVAGLASYPQLNSSVDTETGEIVQHGAIHLGLAAQTPRGLMVPVIHDAHSLSTKQLRDRIAELIEASVTGSFPAEALRGGTFTLNNFGSLGVDGSAAIINFPEAAILGIGRIIDRPWVVDGALAVRKVVELSFVFDHRVCDGAVAAGFLTYIARCIENPITLLSDL